MMFGTQHKAYVRLMAVMFALASALNAQVPSVSSLTPPINDPNADASGTLAATFSTTMTTADTSNFVVVGDLSGRPDGSYLGAFTNTLLFDPSADFHPGETVYVSLTQGLESLGGDALAARKVWSFRVAAGTGVARFVDFSQNFGTQSKLYKSVAAGDIDGDGDIDVVTAVWQASNEVFFNDGSGVLSAGGTFGTGIDQSSWVALGDMDGDGDLDIVLANFNEPNRVYFNDGSGGFASPVAFGTNSDPTTGLAVGDFDGDGDLDVAVANSSSSAPKGQAVVYFNNGAGSLSASSVNIGANNALSSSIVAGDIDKDGDLDIVIGNESTVAPNGQTRAYFNNGSGAFSTIKTIGPNNAPTRSLALGDVNGDGYLDAAVALGNNQQSLIYTYDGSTFSAASNYGGTESAGCVIFADVDGDGDLDIARGNRLQQNQVYLNSGTGDFTAETGRNFGSGVDYTVAVAAADFDGNGSLDLVGVNQSNTQFNTLSLNKIPETWMAFSSATFSAAETHASATITVTRTGGSTGAVSVQYTTSAGTATTGVDYTDASGTLSFADGETGSKTFTVTILADATAEANETVNLALSSPGGGGMLGTQATATLSILDDDTAPTVQLAAANTDFTETTNNATIFVELSNPYSQDVSINYAVSSITAIENQDWWPTSGTLTITAGDTSNSFKVLVLDDETSEPDETALITISSPVNATLGARTTSTLTIKDNDNRPSVQFASASSSRDETTGNATINLSLSTESASDVSVTYAISGGTALAGFDFTTISGTLTIVAGQTSQTLSLPILGDLLDEDNETVILSLSSPVNADLGSNATHTLTLTDDDEPPTVQISGAAVNVAEAAGSATVTVMLSTVSGRSITVSYATTSGTAVTPADFTATSGVLTIAPGVASENVTIPLVTDSMDENDESLSFAIASPSNATLGAQTSTTITIVDDDAPPTVQFAAANTSVNEAGPVATVALTLSAASGKTVTVDYATSDGSATASSDYTAATGTVTFSPGDSAKTLSINLPDDMVIEANETVNLALSNPVNAGLGSPDTATLTLIDNDSIPTINLSSTAYSVAEGTSSITITVALSNPYRVATTVAYSVTGITATAGSDFTAGSGVLTFAAGETSKTFAVAILSDVLDEGDETIDITISAPGNGTLGSNTSATLTILDDDATPSVTLASATTTAAESAGHIDLTVNLSNPSGNTVTVDYHTADGTALAGTDYTAANGTLTFTPGQTTKTISVQIAANAVITPNTTLTLSISNPVNATMGAISAATLTILDDDATPNIDFTSAIWSVNENTASLDISVMLANPTTNTVIVSYANIGGTATAGSDFTALSGQLTFSPGETLKSFTLAITNDATDENDETVALGLSGASGGNLGTVTTCIVTIVDEDSPPTFNFSTGAYSVAEAAASATITVTLSTASGIAVSVNYGTADGTATAGSDYLSASNTLNFAIGETSKTFTVSILNDGAIENSETIVLALSSPVGATVGSQGTALLSIVDDDNAPAVNFSASNTNASESIGTVTVTVQLASAAGGATSVGYAATSAGATGGSDFLTTSGTLNFAAGETSKTFTVTITNDSSDEDDETIALALSNYVGLSAGATVTATITVQDDDAPPTVAFAASNTNFTEAGDDATVAVSLSAPSGKTVTVNYATSNGSAQAGTDYVATSGTLTFTPGQSSKNITVTVNDDSTQESDETINLQLSSPTNASIGSPSSATLSIIDNDGTPTVAFAAASSSVVENAGTATITVQLSAPSSSTVTVQYATSNNTATAGADYTATNGTLSFSAGQTSKTFTVAITDDSNIESSELVNLSLSSPTNATLGSQASATLTIHDNDTIPTVQFSSATKTVSEGTSTVSLTLTLSVEVEFPIALDYATSNVTATAGSDYTQKSATLTIPAGNSSATISISIIDDLVAESTETFRVTLSNPEDCSIGAQDTSTVSITDNDTAPTISLSATSIDVSESATSVALTVTLSSATGQAVSVDYATEDGTATAPGDYTAASNTLTISTGQTSKTFTLSLRDDGLDEPTESFTVRLSDPAGATLGATTSITVNILDDDDPPPAGAPVFRSTVITDADAYYKPGDHVSILADLGESGLSVKANLRVIDSAMGSAVAFSDNGDGTYSLTSPALASSTLKEGQDIAISVTATNSEDLSVSDVVLVTIDKTAPTARLSYNMPRTAVPAGTLQITLSLSEAIAARPSLSITGLGQALDVSSAVMGGNAPGSSFTYAYGIPSGTTGSATLSISNAADLAGNTATAPTDAGITVVGTGATLVANAGSDLALGALQVVQLDGSASIGASTYAWSQRSGPATLALSNANTAIATCHPKLSGRYVFELTVTAGALSATDIVEIEVPNVPPVAQAGADINLAATDVTSSGGITRMTVGLSGSAYDANGDTLYPTWILTSAPSGANLSLESPNAMSTRLIVHGSSAVGGVYVFTLSIFDPTGKKSGDAVTDTVRVVVISDTVLPPAAHAGMDQTVAVGQVVHLSANESSDPDAADQANPGLSYAWSFVKKPAGATPSLSGSSTRTPSFTPSRAGVYILALTVTDAGNFKSGSDNVTIIAINTSGASANYLSRAVISTTLADTDGNGTLNVGESITLGSSASLDGDNDALTFTWEQLSGPDALLMQDENAATQTFSPTTKGSYTFRLTPHDGTDEGIPAELTFVVAPQGKVAPKAVATIASSDDGDNDGYVLFIPGVGVENDSSNVAINLSAAQSTKDPSATLSYRWTQTGGPTVAVTGATSQTMAFAPLISRVYEFTLTVTDSFGIEVSTILKLGVDTWHATANPDGNTIPRAQASAPGNVSVGQTITLTGSGYDPNDSDLIFYWVQVAGPPVVLNLADPEHPTFVAPIAAEYVFELAVDDGADIGLAVRVSVKVKAASGGGDPTPGGKKGGGGGGGCALASDAMPLPLCFGLVFMLFVWRRARTASRCRRATRSLFMGLSVVSPIPERRRCRRGALFGRSAMPTRMASDHAGSATVVSRFLQVIVDSLPRKVHQSFSCTLDCFAVALQSEASSASPSLPRKRESIFNLKMPRSILRWQRQRSNAGNTTESP